MAIAESEVAEIPSEKLSQVKGTSTKAGRGTETTKKTKRKARDGSHPKAMNSTEETRVGGYGGPREFDDLELTPISWVVDSQLNVARKAFLNRLEELKANFPDQWVAFDGEVLLGAAESEPELISRFNPDGKLTGRLFTDFVYGE